MYCLGSGNWFHHGQKVRQCRLSSRHTSRQASWSPNRKSFPVVNQQSVSITERAVFAVVDQSASQSAQLSSRKATQSSTGQLGVKIDVNRGG